MKQLGIKYFMALICICTVSACSSDTDHPAKNILDKPEVTVPDLKESSALVTWKAVGNATAYCYSLENGEEVTTDMNTVQLTGLEPDKTYMFKVKAMKPGSLYFEDSEYAEITFTTTSHVKIYRVATFADDWDKWYYEYNDNGTVKRIYRMDGENLDREWIFAYDGNNVSVTGKNEYSITLNEQGYAATFNDGWDVYSYTYNEDGYMTKVERGGKIFSNITIENGNIMKWSKFTDDVEQFKIQTYSSIPNTGGAHCIYSEKAGASRWLMETGLFGKASAYCHETNGWDYSATWSKFTFEYDANGCIVKEMKDYDGYVENFFYTYYSE